MDTDSERIEATQSSSEDSAIVVQIGWVQVTVMFAVVVGLVVALTAGMWVGRYFGTGSRASAPARGSVSQPSTIGQVVPAQPQQIAPPRQPQPRVQAQPVAPPSSAGVTTSIGRTPNAGETAPGFTLKNLDGEKVSLGDFAGRPVLINFWATWCGPCRYEMPVIEEMYQTYQDEGFVVLAVNVEESITVVQSFTQSMGLTFPILLDYKGAVSDDVYRVRAFPTSYFIGRDGQITAMHRGMMNHQTMQRYMDQVLATQPAAEN